MQAATEEDAETIERAALFLLAMDVVTDDASLKKKIIKWEHT